MEIGLISKYGSGAANYDENLLFYSYKLMTEKLQDSNWDKAEILRESDGIHIYKFPKKNSTGVVWAAWTEGIPAE